MSDRMKVRFAVGSTYCVAWHDPGENGACVVMGSGAGVPKEPGTDRFAARFRAAGFSVLAFDHRHVGGSGGSPRQVVRVDEQLADWRAAVEFATALPEVAPGGVALWGFSLAGGHVLRVAAERPGIAAVIAQTPLVDGPATTRAALRYTTPGAMARLAGRALADVVGRRFGRDPLLVPLAGKPGTVAMLTTPDSLDYEAALDPGDSVAGWDPRIAAWSALRISRYRPGRFAERVTAPVLFVVADQDRSALAAPALAAAGRVPRAEVVRVPGGHYAPFLAEHERVVEAEIGFLRRHLPVVAGGSRPAGTMSS